MMDGSNDVQYPTILDEGRVVEHNSCFSRPGALCVQSTSLQIRRMDLEERP